MHKILLLIHLLLISTLTIKAQEDTKWIKLEDNDQITLYYASGNCGEELLFLKADRKSSEVKQAILTVELITDGIPMKNTFLIEFNENNSFVYDCNRPPHVNPGGFENFNGASEIKFISLNIQTY